MDSSLILADHLEIGEPGGRGAHYWHRIAPDGKRRVVNVGPRGKKSCYIAGYCL